MRPLLLARLVPVRDYLTSGNINKLDTVFRLGEGFPEVSRIDWEKLERCKAFRLSVAVA